MRKNMSQIKIGKISLRKLSIEETTETGINMSPVNLTEKSYHQILVDFLSKL